MMSPLSIGKHKLLFVAMSVVLLSSCSKKIEVQGEPPVDKLTFYKHWIEVYPLPNTTLSDFVDMKMFGVFYPEITFDQAEAKVGLPNNIRKDGYNIYHEYWTDLARIEIGREEYSTGDGVGVAWALYSYPAKNMDYAELLPEAIAKHIDPNAEKTSIVIRNQGNEAAVSVNIKGRRVENLNWFRIY